MDGGESQGCGWQSVIRNWAQNLTTRGPFVGRGAKHFTVSLNFMFCGWGHSDLTTRCINSRPRWNSGHLMPKHQLYPGRTFRRFNNCAAQGDRDQHNASRVTGGWHSGTGKGGHWDCSGECLFPNWHWGSIPVYLTIQSDALGHVSWVSTLFPTVFSQAAFLQGLISTCQIKYGNLFPAQTN